MLGYNLADWFWFVGSNKEEVFSSAALDYLPVSHESYESFLQKGGVASFAPNEAALYEHINRLICLRLEALDVKKIRAMCDAVLSGDKTRLTALEAEAAALRSRMA